MKGLFLRAGVFVLLSLWMLVGCATQGGYTTPGGLAHLIASRTEAYILMDVRTQPEYASGHIPTAINVPLPTVGQNLPSEEKGALIIVYCQSGGRSRAAKAVLEKLGFTRVMDFGSILNWKGELVTGMAPTERTGS